jgi:16S rRNA (adenine1518-N6/adenine1519-N6)-dimethyltransferase
MTVVPKRALGQHFLVDENILGVIGRLSELGPHDVVLEVGPGLGVLTLYLADRVALVHAIELDRTLEPRLTAALGSRTNVRLLFGDALRLDRAALDPQPVKLVANLPYNVATPLVVETLVAPGALRHWCVMVQREVADRFFAEPSTKPTARRTGRHAVSRSVFRPSPNVDSALVAFSRVEPPANLAFVRTVVEAAFSHRRKTLGNALELSGLFPRDVAAGALESLGRRPDVRAEALAPPEFVALAEALAGR